MYPNLNAEMARLNITQLQIAYFLDKPIGWVHNRFQGRAILDVKYAIEIHKQFFPELPFDYIFSNVPYKELHDKK